MRIEPPQCGRTKKGRKELRCPRYSFGKRSSINQGVIFFVPINGIMLKQTQS